MCNIVSADTNQGVKQKNVVTIGRQSDLDIGRALKIFVWFGFFSWCCGVGYHPAVVAIRWYIILCSIFGLTGHVGSGEYVQDALVVLSTIFGTVLLSLGQTKHWRFRGGLKLVEKVGTYEYSKECLKYSADFGEDSKYLDLKFYIIPFLDDNFVGTLLCTIYVMILFILLIVDSFFNTTGAFDSVGQIIGWFIGLFSFHFVQGLIFMVYGKCKIRREFTGSYALGLDEQKQKIKERNKNKSSKKSENEEEDGKEEKEDDANGENHSEHKPKSRKSRNDRVRTESLLDLPGKHNNM